MNFNITKPSVRIEHYGTDDMYAVTDLELKIRPNGDMVLRHYDSVTNKDIYLYTDNRNGGFVDECREPITLDIFLKRIWEGMQ